MRYIDDGEMALYVGRELLPGLAEDRATEFYERHGLRLDRTPESLAAIDDLFSAQGDMADLSSLSAPLAAYLGVVLARLDGGLWGDKERTVPSSRS